MTQQLSKNFIWLKKYNENTAYLKEYLESVRSVNKVKGVKMLDYLSQNDLSDWFTSYYYTGDEYDEQWFHSNLTRMQPKLARLIVGLEKKLLKKKKHTTNTMNTENNNIANNKMKRYNIYDTVKARNVSFTNPYGRVAKRLYKQLIDQGTEPNMAVIPNDLKYYPRSKRFIKVKDPSSPIDYSKFKVTERSSFKQYMASFTILNDTDITAYAGIELINGFRGKLESMMALHKGVKFYIDVQCLMKKYLDGDEITQDTRWVASQLMQATNSKELDSKIKSSISMIKEKIPELESKNGSFWVFKQVLKIDLHVARYRPVVGKSYVKLPDKLRLKKAIVNVQNTDNECFKWAILSALYPATKNAERVSKYKNIDHNLTFTQFPMPISDITKFENLNQLQSTSMGLTAPARHTYSRNQIRKSQNILICYYTKSITVGLKISLGFVVITKLMGNARLTIATIASRATSHKGR